MPVIDPIHATDSAAVAGLAGLLADAPEIAFDTEFLWERTYRPVLCLVQVAADGAIATVDPLGDADLSPLWEVLTAVPTLLVHAGEHDLGILARAGGGLPDRVFDTQSAAGFLGLGDRPGYTALVQRVLGERPRSGEGYTDWSRRPLSDAQIGYALDDVRYLLPLARDLQEDLRRRDRLAWVEEEIALELEGVGADPDPDEQWRKVSGARKLRGRALAILRAVAAWRERRAVSRDLPRQRVVPDRVLIEIARRAPDSAAAISRLRGLHPRQAEQVAAPLAEVVRTAADTPRDSWPAWPAPHRHADDPRLDAISALLQALVRTRAAGLDLAPRLLGTRADLDRLAQDHLAGTIDPADHPLLRGWRRDAIGAEALRLLGGELALRVSGDDPAGVVADPADIN